MLFVKKTMRKLYPFNYFFIYNVFHTQFYWKAFFWRHVVTIVARSWVLGFNHVIFSLRRKRKKWKVSRELTIMYDFAESCNSPNRGNVKLFRPFNLDSGKAEI